jgi:hypothetical protein
MHIKFTALLAACLSAVLPVIAMAAKPSFLEKVVGPPSAERVVLIVEDPGILPPRNNNDTTGVGFDQVDLAKNHNVMEGYNNVYLGGTQLKEGEIVKGWFPKEAVPTAYHIFGAPGAYDYALTSYSRTNRAAVENQCYYEQAVVFRLKPGVINYIPKTLQPPLYDGNPVDSATLKPDTTELRRVLAKYPVSQMEIVVPDVVAIIKYSPNKFDRVMSHNPCSYKDDFTVIRQLMPDMPVR